MALIADLTFVHMEARSVIDRIDRRLEDLDRAGPDTQRALRSLDQIAHDSVRLRQQLEQFFERERRELLPRVRRICGSDIREVSTLIDTQEGVLDSLDHFIASVDDAEPGEGPPGKSKATLQEMFEEFADRFDHRCDVERTFYQSFSTILFPGGVATD